MTISVSKFVGTAVLVFYIVGVPEAQSADPNQGISKKSTQSTVITKRTAVDPGLNLSTLEIVVTNVPGNPRDWVGIFAHGDPNTAYKDWRYVACDSQTCPIQKAPSGSTQKVHLAIPPSLAQADIRLMSVGPDGAYHVITEIDPDFSTH